MARRRVAGLRPALSRRRCAVPAGASAGAQAALFDDDEARKAILDLRQRVDAERASRRARATPS